MATLKRKNLQDVEIRNKRFVFVLLRLSPFPTASPSCRIKMLEAELEATKQWTTSYLNKMKEMSDGRDVTIKKLVKELGFEEVPNGGAADKGSAPSVGLVTSLPPHRCS